MHLQQTKASSRASGGPQYYFHDLTEDVCEFLRRKGSRSVVLQTPYGIVETPFVAVGKDHKLDKLGQVIEGKVGHDRIQQGTRAKESIGEAIRRWYCVRDNEIERIEIDVRLYPTGVFGICPLSLRFAGDSEPKELPRTDYPLSFNRYYQDSLWRSHLIECYRMSAADVNWARDQLKDILRDYDETPKIEVSDTDLLRAAGALANLGLKLGPYCKSRACKNSVFQFRSLPEFRWHIELRKCSRLFTRPYLECASPLQSILLCFDHDADDERDSAVIELRALALWLENPLNPPDLWKTLVQPKLRKKYVR